jgi:hypothetical protein
MKQTAYKEQPTPGTPPGKKTTDENTKGAREKGGGRVLNSLLLTRFKNARIHTYTK